MGKKEDPAPSSTTSYAAVVSGRGIGKQSHSDSSAPPGSANVDLAKDPQHKNPFLVSKSNAASSHSQGNPVSQVGVVSQGTPATQVGVISQVPIGPTSGLPPSYDSVTRPKNPFLVHKFPAHSPRPVAPGNPFLARKQTSGPQKLLSQHSGPSSLASTGTALHLKGVPPIVNNKEFMLEHFGKFGEVESINCNIKKMCTNVTFKTNVSYASHKCSVHE